MITADRDGNDCVFQKRKLQEHQLNDRVVCHKKIVMTKQIEASNCFLCSFSTHVFHTFVHSYTHSIDQQLNQSTGRVIRTIAKPRNAKGKSIQYPCKLSSHLSATPTQSEPFIDLCLALVDDGAAQ